MSDVVFFAIYSTDASPNGDYASATSYVVFPQPAYNAGDFGSSYKEEPLDGRGEVIETFGSVVVQDFGLVSSEKGKRIKFSDVDALDAQTKSALEIMYSAVDTDWYFTNGIDLFKVRFSRKPAGLKTYRNLLWAQHGRTYHSYEIELVVVSKETLSFT